MFTFPFPDKFGKGTEDLIKKKIYTNDKIFKVTRVADVLKSTTTIDVGSPNWRGDLEVDATVQGIALKAFASTNNQKHFKAAFDATADTQIEAQVGNTNNKRPKENHFTATVSHSSKLYAGRLKVDKVQNEADGGDGTYFQLGGVACADSVAFGAEIKGDAEEPGNTDKFDLTYGLVYQEAGFEAFVKSVSTKKRYTLDDSDADKDEYVCGITQRVDDQYTFGVQINFDAGAEKKTEDAKPSTVLVLGGEYRIDSSTTVKAKVDSQSKGAFAISQRISNGLVELSADFDKSGSVSKHGFKVSLGD